MLQIMMKGNRTVGPRYALQKGKKKPGAASGHPEKRLVSLLPLDGPIFYRVLSEKVHRAL